MNVLWREFHACYGYEALHWGVDDDLTLHLTIRLVKRGGYDAGTQIGDIEVTGKTARTCFSRAITRFNTEPWIKSAITGRL